MSEKSPEIPRGEQQEEKTSQEAEKAEPEAKSAEAKRRREKKLFELMDKAERAETTPEKTKILKEMRRVAEGREVKEFVSIEEAKEILGQENVLGLEDVEKYMLDGGKLEDIWLPDVLEAKVKRIPYSEKELERAKKCGEKLVLRSDTITIPNEGTYVGITIERLKKKFPDYFIQGKEWYKDESFFKYRQIGVRWKLVRKEPMMRGITYRQQENTMKIKEPGSHEELERRRPVEIVYDTILYWLKNGKPPFENASDWSSEKLSPKKIVRVGVEPEEVTKGGHANRIVIGSNHPDHPRDNLGVCPQR